MAYVTNRDYNLFVPSYLDMSQLDDEIAIVEVEGKKMFFDPGERYAEFGNLHWKHAATQGIRQTDGGTAVFLSPSPVYKSTTEIRLANLEIKPDGKVSGTIRIALTGTAALRCAQFCPEQRRGRAEAAIYRPVQAQMPAGTSK